MSAGLRINEFERMVNCKVMIAPFAQPFDDDYLAFRDLKPATSHHYLVIPKNHIANVDALTPSDIGLVRKLVEIGEIVLNNNSASVPDARPGHQHSLLDAVAFPSYTRHARLERDLAGQESIAMNCLTAY
ncbi:histidine triad nucleotide-binding protein 3 [Trichonephila clavipes]|nr:histidine triad nucleotide-binding protein 3 [Trichonephila clavipes]